jgi:hypothetical protein
MRGWIRGGGDEGEPAEFKNRAGHLCKCALMANPSYLYQPGFEVLIATP